MENLFVREFRVMQVFVWILHKKKATGGTLYAFYRLIKSLQIHMELKKLRHDIKYAVCRLYDYDTYWTVGYDTS